MMLKSCTLLACVGGLALAQNARADAPPDDPNKSPTTQPANPEAPAPTATEAPEPCPPGTPGYSQQQSTTTTTTTTPPATNVAPTYYNEEGAREEEEPGMYSYAWYEPRLASGIGIGMSIGGGVNGFTDSLMRDTMSSSVGGTWDFRATLGTHVPIGLDLSYVGTASDINTFTGAHNGTLIGTTAEGALRWNILPHYAFNPYIFGGAGWLHYDVHNIEFATADTGMRSSSNSFEVPMGGGISLRDMSGFMFDVRGVYRWVNSTDLLIDPRTGDRASLSQWEASANLGYEF